MRASPLILSLAITGKFHTLIGIHLYETYCKPHAKNDIDDQVEFDNFALVESHTQNDITQNDTDPVLPTVDVTIRRPGHMMPVDGNIWVSVDLTLTDVNTQTTGIGLTRDYDDQVEIDDFALVESHSQNDLTLTPSWRCE